MRRSGERQLKALEASYRETLLLALHHCAQGKWGLFGQNEAALARQNLKMLERLRDPAVGELLELGSQIDRLRSRLGYAVRFPRNDRLMQMRSAYNAKSLGEPKLAKQWLEDILA